MNDPILRHPQGSNPLQDPFLSSNRRASRRGNAPRRVSSRQRRRLRGSRRIQQEIELAPQYKPPKSAPTNISVSIGVPVVQLPPQVRTGYNPVTHRWESAFVRNSTYRSQVVDSCSTNQKHHVNSNPAEDLSIPLWSNGICCLQCVRTQELGIVETCGEFEEVIGPGIYTGGCWPISVVVSRLSLRVQQIDVTLESKTKDNVFVFVTVSIQFRVLLERAYDAYYGLTDVRRQIKTYVFDVIRSTLPKMDLDYLFVTKSEISDQVFVRLQRVMKEYGYEIVSTLITKIEPNEKVRQSMNEVNACRREREGVHHKAEAAKYVKVKAAEATMEQMHLHGVGISKQRAAIVGGLMSSICDYSAETGRSPKDVMDLVLQLQYVDMLSTVGAQDLIIGGDFPARA